MNSKSKSVFILLSILSSCMPMGWVPGGVGSRTSMRIIGAAARQLGLRLGTELSIYKKKNGPLFRVTFIGRRYFMTHWCEAVVHEFVPFRPKLVSHTCRPPV